ncbi:Dedicator of cytokinesis protein 7 [Amphibalanus amphitrite]|uniref:Dedicator of cytokinesis protein 7 n=1 Tax=Amphibalanus amphitrite TaxID=1232801 RepID=A0A6A4W1C8_AMPAM|nr:Dedicator of cytokinesis protein 7 [Amphibalanus amphitrite]
MHGLRYRDFTVSTRSGFGVDSVHTIKGSSRVESAQLDPEAAYIQITYVEPYFDAWERRTRLTAFERNFNISECCRQRQLEKGPMKMVRVGARFGQGRPSFSCLAGRATRRMSAHIICAIPDFS